MIAGKVRVSLRQSFSIGHTGTVPFDQIDGDRVATVIGSTITSRSLRVGGSAVALTGLVLVVVGTFAPWLSSGGVDRDSYAIAGIVGRLGLDGDGFGGTALSGWPFLGPIAMVALIAAILRWWRTCAWIAIAFGTLTGVIGGGVLAVAGGHTAADITLAATGPVITVIGAAVSIVGGSVILLAGRGRSRRVDQTSHESVPGSTEPFHSPYRQSDPGVPDRPQSSADRSEVQTAAKGPRPR